MKKLTQKEVLEMSETKQLELLLKFQDEACNLDYILYPIESDILQRNTSLLEQVLIYKEL